MYLSDVLDLHKSYEHPRSVPKILGDSFLLQTNTIYRAVRELSLEIGCSYIEAYPRYLLMPFHELGTIVATKNVPFVPAAQLAEEIEANHPGMFTTQDVPIPESYHLHEAAHVIAEHFFKDVKLSGPQEKILKTMLCESFANSVDAMVCVPATDDIQYFFVKQNSYMSPRKNVMQAMSSLNAAMGPTFTFMLTFFTYLHANFLASPPKKKFVQDLASKYAGHAKLNPRTQKDIQTVIAIGEKLDHQFRLTTTANYLKQEGYRGELQDVLDFAFLDVFIKNEGFAKSLNSLSDAISRASSVSN